MNRLLFAFLLASALSAVPIAPADERKDAPGTGDRAPAEPGPLPHPKTFEPARYLGKWFEAARLPMAIQPNDTLATAEYSAGEGEGVVRVKNTAYDTDGNVVATIEGQARLAPGDPPGRLIVGFGPFLPEAPNYHVLHVDPDYRHAVVGVPDRKSLWILVRKVPVAKAKLDELIAIARKAGFDTSKLLIAPWRDPEGDEAADE